MRFYIAEARLLIGDNSQASLLCNADYAIIQCMKTLNVAISDVEYTKFGITNNVLSFSEFVDMVSKELMRENMEAVITQADICGISSMSMEDISTEVQAVRSNAKNNN